MTPAEQARRRRRSVPRPGDVAAYLVAILATVITLFPLYWLVVISTKTPREAFKSPPDLLYVPDFGKYLTVWKTAGIGEAFLNSTIVVILGVGLALAIAVPAAYAIVRFRVRARRALMLWLLLAYATPEFLFVIPMYVLYHQIGLYDTQIGLALIYQVFAVPFAVWLLQSFFVEVPAEIGDAARIDGASDLQILTRVYVPLSGPGIAATAVLIAIAMWNEVTIALSLTQAQSQTVSIAIAGFRGYAAIRWQEMAAAAVLAVIPMIVLAAVAQRYLVKGLTFGAVK